VITISQILHGNRLLTLDPLLEFNKLLLQPRRPYDEQHKIQAGKDTTVSMIREMLLATALGVVPRRLAIATLLE
jgi:hypothetical protein